MASGSFEAKTSNKYINGTLNWSSTLNSLNNTSTVTASMTLRKQYHYPDSVLVTSGLGTWTIYINSIPYTINASKSFNFNSDTVVISNTVVVQHDESGSKSCQIKVTGGISGTTYTSTRAEGLAVLDTNVVKGTILTAPNFTDLENPTITFSNPKNYPIQFKIEDRVRYIDLIVSEKFVDYEGDSYTFELTEEQRDILRVASQDYGEFPIRFTVATYIPASSGSPTYFSWLDRLMYVTEGSPVFTDFNHEDVEPETLALTGNSSVYIQNFSKCRVSVPNAKKMIAQKDSVGKGYTAWLGDKNNYQPYSDDLDIIFASMPVNFYSSSPTVSVTAFDSRSKKTTVDKPINLIPYDLEKNQANFYVYRENGFGSTVVVNARGSYNPIIVGGVEKNEVKVTFRYVDSSIPEPWEWTYQEYTVVLNNGQFNDNRKFTLDADTVYRYQIWADDKLDFLDSAGDEFLYSSNPIVYLDKDFKVGINMIPDDIYMGLYLKDSDIFYTRFKKYFDNYLYQDLYNKITNELFPVGSCYTTTSDPFDPPVAGVWTQIANVYDSDNIVVAYIYSRTE